MVSAWRRALLAGAVATLVACALPSADEFSRPASTAVTTSDGSALADARFDVSDASNADAAVLDGSSVDAGVEVLPVADSTYEDGTCGPDTAGYESSFSASAPAHTGAGACEVCRTDTSAGGLYTIDTNVPAKPTAGATYIATAWVRRPPGSSDTTLIGMTLRTHNGDFNGIDQTDSVQVMLSDAYQVLTLTLPITRNARFMDVFVGSIPPVDESPACFLIDDLSVVRQ